VLELINAELRSTRLSGYPILAATPPDGLRV